MPIYRTGPDRSLEDVIAQIETKGEEIAALDQQGGEWVVLTKFPAPNDTGRPWLPISHLGATETRG